MIKPGALREHLTAALPELRRDPDKLTVYIDKGSLSATAVPGLSFEYAYTLVITLLDFAQHPDAIMVPLLAWLRFQQPELLANPQRRGEIGFEAEFLRNDLVDLTISLPLTERVGVHTDAQGRMQVEHYPEPLLDDTDWPEYWEVYLKGQLIGSWGTPKP